jgi:hypothetical protein
VIEKFETIFFNYSLKQTQMSVFIHKWTNEEDAGLLSEVAQHIPLDEIALAHGRTPNAIKLRIMRHALTEKKAGSNSQQIMDKFGITCDELSKFELDYAKKTKNNDPTNEMLSIISQTTMNDHDLDVVFSVLYHISPETAHLLRVSHGHKMIKGGQSPQLVATLLRLTNDEIKLTSS